VNIQLLNFI